MGLYITQNMKLWYMYTHTYTHHIYSFVKTRDVEGDFDIYVNVCYSFIMVFVLQKNAHLCHIRRSVAAQVSAPATVVWFISTTVVDMEVFLCCVKRWRRLPSLGLSIDNFCVEVKSSNTEIIILIICTASTR